MVAAMLLEAAAFSSDTNRLGAPRRPGSKEEGCAEGNVGEAEADHHPHRIGEQESASGEKDRLERIEVASVAVVDGAGAHVEVPRPVHERNSGLTEDADQRR